MQLIIKPATEIIILHAAEHLFVSTVIEVDRILQIGRILDIFNRLSPAINHTPFNPPACQCVYEGYSCLVVVNVHFVHILTHVDVIRALTHQLDAEWREFGTFVHVEPAIMDGIEKDKASVGACMLQLVEDWVCHNDGTGDLPRDLDNSSASS